MNLIRILLVLMLVIGLGVLNTSSVAASPKPLQNQDGTGCSAYIPANVTEVDGSTNYSSIKPGDTLCMAAGVRANLKLINLRGEPGKPITVRNEGGTVTISGKTLENGGIVIYSSSYLRLTGSGSSLECGAQYSTEMQKCGIVIKGTQKGIKIQTGKGTGDVSNLEIDHVWVSDTAQDTKTRGIAIHPEEGQLISGLYIHHNYVARTLAEGIYMGTEPHGRPYDVLGKIENLEVSYNLVEQTGYDGIKVKVAIQNVQVHHNVVHLAGLSKTPHHQGGITAAVSTGDFYNNYVDYVYQGIRTNRPLENPVTRYFNNVVLNTSHAGMQIKEGGAQIFNNSVVSCGAWGIMANAKTAHVFNNIVAGCDGIAMRRIFKADSTNLVGPVKRIGFNNPDQNDFRLRPDSSAVDVGVSSPDVPGFDYNQAPRPEGKGIDIGAYEYQGGLASLWGK